ncbi:hypothetical protein BDV28DRAFT_127666 [Aspergillus coremiiformis]|uniref:Uncharacterized protein n=1 Tax=Aspergillus coremiiformis TaxID=138285 RepID=A0A5N6ZH60_9EURO|nr:hypothetical protein BDV28DRAFT_127666 [Aspergillus coremiiformis]
MRHRSRLGYQLTGGHQAVSPLGPRLLFLSSGSDKGKVSCWKPLRDSYRIARCLGTEKSVASKSGELELSSSLFFACASMLLNLIGRPLPPRAFSVVCAVECLVVRDPLENCPLPKRLFVRIPRKRNGVFRQTDRSS